MAAEARRTAVDDAASRPRPDGRRAAPSRAAREPTDQHHDTRCPSSPGARTTCASCGAHPWHARCKPAGEPSPADRHACPAPTPPCRARRAHRHVRARYRSRARRRPRPARLPQRPHERRRSLPPRGCAGTRARPVAGPAPRRAAGPRCAAIARASRVPQLQRSPPRPVPRQCTGAIPATARISIATTTAWAASRPAVARTVRAGPLLRTIPLNTDARPDSRKASESSAVRLDRSKTRECRVRGHDGCVQRPQVAS